MNGIKILPRQHLVVVAFEGSVSFTELIQATSDLLEHPNYREDFDGVTDYRGAQLTITEAEKTFFSRRSLEERKFSGTWCLLFSAPQLASVEDFLPAIFQTKNPVDLYSSVTALSGGLGQDISPYLTEPES